MTLADFADDIREKREDETIREYYVDLRSDSLSLSSKDSVKTSWNRLQDYLDEVNSSRKPKGEIRFEDLTKSRVLEFIDWLDVKDTTANNYIGDLAAMVAWFNNKGMMSGNPFKEALATDPFENTGKTPKMEVGIDKLRSAISDIDGPLALAVIVVFLKTGIRIAELANLDERDLHIDHPISGRLDKPRPEIKNKPDSIYIDSSIDEGECVNGEVRPDSNKPNSTRAIPIDSEVKSVLVWYLAMKPRSDSPANPLLVINNKGGKEISQRLGTEAARRIVNEWSDNHGWYTPNSSFGVKPHWCRHWFSTMIQSNADGDLIEVGDKDDYEDFLRGDQSSSTKSDYLQMGWGRNDWMHEVLEDALPSLLTASENQ
jgi:integrase/recombinase XerC